MCAGRARADVASNGVAWNHATEKGRIVFAPSPDTLNKASRDHDTLNKASLDHDTLNKASLDHDTLNKASRDHDTLFKASRDHDTLFDHELRLIPKHARVETENMYVFFSFLRTRIEGVDSIPTFCVVLGGRGTDDEAERVVT